MAALTLLKHTQPQGAQTAEAYAKGWVSEATPDHPPIPDVLDVLRRRVMGHTPHMDERVIWYPHDACWTAVVDLHQVARHDDATALALLLAWCDSHGHGYAWEITIKPPAEVPHA
jgi:hypothetical protein